MSPREPAAGISSVCVYCASSEGNLPVFVESARALGQLLAENGIRLVYGGGGRGLMGAVADGALAAGGEVIGVLPRSLFGRELAHPGLTELIEVDSMHTRKQKMCDLAEAFVALPGGLGTLEELTEIATWSQLGLHAKPILTLDLNGYWTPLHDLLRAAVASGFVKPESLGLIVNVATLDEVLPRISDYVAPYATKWLKPGET